MTLVKWTPKRNMFNIFDEVEQMMHQAFGHSLENGSSRLSYSPLMNVSDRVGDYLVMMDLPGVGKKDVDINLTPLIDVVFLLLIFFMVSTTFIKESEIELTLPQATEDIREELTEKIQVSIDRNGTVFVNQQALSSARLDAIRQALNRVREDGGDPVVVIRADAAASHQAVVDVMDASRQAGLYRITFPTRLRQAE